ncbi:MAG TPA: hypothetical protein V6C90_15365 [Coleofasciculaceae cyanobacterium]
MGTVRDRTLKDFSCVQQWREGANSPPEDSPRSQLLSARYKDYNDVLKHTKRAVTATLQLAKKLRCFDSLWQRRHRQLKTKQPACY